MPARSSARLESLATAGWYRNISCYARYMAIHSRSAVASSNQLVLGWGSGVCRYRTVAPGFEVGLEGLRARLDDRPQARGGFGWQEVGDPDKAAALRAVLDNLHRGV